MKRPDLNTAYEVVETPAALAAHCAHWQQRPWLALDTEFVRESTYYAQLCLVQVGDGEQHVCIDALALGDDGLRPLLALLCQAEGPLKVFHAASQDLEILTYLGGGAVQPLFDTQLAAALLGDGDQLGYAALVDKRLGIKLDKSLTRTDWSRRPLRPAEFAYAADDVRWLARLYPMLRDELSQMQRLTWLQEDCARLADPARYRNPPEDAWQRLKGLARLRPQAQRIAIALAVWRERLAQARNRPRKWILDDEPLYRIAERTPRSAGELENLQVLPPKTLSRYGSELLQLVAHGLTGDCSAPLLSPNAPLDETQKAQLQQLQDKVRKVAERLNLPASLLAPRADLESLVRHGAAADIALRHGWRFAAAGAEILGAPA